MPEALTSLVGGNEPACRRALLAALVFVLTVNAAVLSYLVIMLPPLGRSLGLPDIHVASILGLAALLAIVAAPGWGVVVERLGRRPVLLMATAAVTLGSVAFGIAINLGLKGTLSGERLLAVLMVIRAAQAIMAAGMIPASQALISDVTDNHDRTQTMGLIGAAYGMGGIIGGIMMWAFIPSQAGWVFIGFGAAACISFLCVIMWVGRLRKRARRRMGATLSGVSPHLPLAVGFGLMLLAACLARIIWQRRPRHDIARREKPGWA